ncbi:hypothetical protein [Natrinema gelatinilyticum]|uniref:hypothetical protein n=1 Tax=Natrinema gelatinilyticum TaxID=2961571 RepID=UPI0020C46BDF|nr:hypothetical protein [Natrinema gelatinilyticum]
MVPMTSSTTNTSDRGLFETNFSIGAVAVAAVAALLAVFFAWLGYTDGIVPVIGYQMNILTGMVGMLFGAGIALVAFVIAAYMEPGFDE